MGFHDLWQKKIRYSAKIRKSWWLGNCEIVNQCDIGKPKKLIHLEILVVEEIANSFMEASKKELMTSTGSCLNSEKSVLVEIANSFMEAPKIFDEFDRIREVWKGKTYLAWNWKSCRLEKKKVTMPYYKKNLFIRNYNSCYQKNCNCQIRNSKIIVKYHEINKKISWNPINSRELQSHEPSGLLYRCMVISILIRINNETWQGHLHSCIY